MIRVIFGAALAAGLYWGWQHLPSAEEREAARAQSRAEREEARLAAKAEYVAQNLPAGCTIDHLPKYGPVEHIVMVRCPAHDTTIANNYWQESRTYNCGKSICTAYDDKQSAAIHLADPEQGH